jgi:YVTN family beta-propeller protein
VGGVVDRFTREQGGEHTWETRWIVISLFIVGSFLAGCSLGGLGVTGQFGRKATEENLGARLSVFLNLKAASGPDVWWRISAIDVRAGDIWIPILSRPLEIDAAKIGSGQVLLTSKSVPPGLYTELRITAEKASLRQGGQMLFLALEQPAFTFPMSQGVSLGKDDSQCVLITWDVTKSLRNTALLDPDLTVSPQSIPLTADLAYVTCPDIDTVYIIRTDTNRVTGALGVTGRPTYLALDQPRNRLYVLATGEAAIKAVELSTNRVVDVMQVPLSLSPSFMTLGAEGRWAYVLDQRNDYVVRMDLLSGSLAGRMRLGEGPEYALYLPEQDLLAVSSTLSQTVYLLDPVTLEQQREPISVGRSPQGLLVFRNQLYIAESDSNTVSVYDLSAEQITERINVGADPRRLFLNRDRIYVSEYRKGTVSILLPGQLGVSREIPVGKSPLELDSSASRRWLYVGNEGSEDITVIDLTSGRVAGTIPLGSPPQDLAVI